MGLIDREATFRGNIIDHAVSLTKNEFPQFVCKLVAKEIYDEEEKVWVDWTDVDDNEIIAYLVLYGGKGETLNSIQVKKATKWDGLSFQTLNDSDLSKIIVQFRTEYRTYDGKETLQVTWFDEADAEPGRSVRKLDQNELKQLDAKYGQLLKAAGKKVVPAKAGTKKITAKSGTVTAKGIKPTAPKGPVTKKTAPPVSTDDGMPKGHCTKQEAWDTVVELQDKSVDDEKLAKTWLGTIVEVGGGKDQDELTEEQWFEIKEKVLKVTAVF